MKALRSPLVLLWLVIAVVILCSAGQTKKWKPGSALRQMNARVEKAWRDSADLVYAQAKAAIDPRSWIDSLIQVAEINIDSPNHFVENYRDAAGKIGEMFTTINDTVHALEWFRKEYRYMDPAEREGLSEELHARWSILRVCEERAEMDAALEHARYAEQALKATHHGTAVHTRFNVYYAELLGRVGLYREAVERHWVVDSLLYADPRSLDDAGIGSLHQENDLAWSIALTELGDHRSAVDLLRPLVMSGSQTPDVEDWRSRGSRILARCYSSMGVRDSANICRKQGLAFAGREGVDTRTAVARELDEIWLTYQDGRSMSVLEPLDRCIQQQVETGHVERLPFSLGLCALLRARTGQAPVAAIAMADSALAMLAGRNSKGKAIPTAHEFEDAEKSIPVLSFRSAMFDTLHARTGNDHYWEQAIASADRALECLELAGMIRSPAARATLALQRWSAFENVVRINRKAWRSSNGDRRYAEKAFRAMELSKNFLAKGGASSFVNDELDSLVALQLQYSTLASRKHKLNTAPAPSLEKADRVRKLKLWELHRQRELRRVDSLINTNRSNVERITKERTGPQEQWELPDITTVQQALGEREVLVEYFNEQEQLYAIWIAKEGIHFERLNKAKRALSAIVDDCLTGWKPKDDPANQARSARSRDFDLLDEQASAPKDLYDLLMRDQMVKLSPERLVIIPDGELCRLPFEALQDRDQGIVLERCAVRYGYSASMVTEPQEHERTPNNYLGCAPVGFESPYRDAGSHLAYAPTRNSLRGMSARDRYDSLRRSEEEVLKGRELFGGYALVNDSATEANVLDRIGDSRIIHFATHGFVDLQRPERSGLLLAGGRVRDFRPGYLRTDTTDNILYAYEIAQLDLRADLVVLSACQTSDGVYRHGEGIMSLARAFKEAGVNNVVTSLWKVDDIATAEIMRDFLTRVKEGETKPEALRQAKLNYRQTHQEAGVALWAPFILVGDDEALMEAPFDAGPFITAAALLIVIAGSWMAWRHKQLRSLPS